MKTYAGVFIVLALFLVPSLSAAFPGKDPKNADCTKCHKLEKKDAEEIVKKLAPNGTVQNIKVSPIKGLWQIDVAADGRQGMLYLDFSKKYVIGQIIPVEAIGKPAPQQKVDFSKIPLGDAVVMGPGTAKKKVVVFTDPDCPYCRRLHEEMKKVVAQRNDVAFYLILFPLEMHKDAYKKAQAVLCEKSPALADDAFSGKALPEPTCPADAVERNKELAKTLGFGGTPTMVRDDGTVQSGYLPAEQLLNWIDNKK